VANLLGNACKFTADGGEVRLTLDREESQAVIRIRDSGIGIAAERLNDIFEMFAQVDHSLERPHSGLGIGLTLARSLVEMHGGAIAARSEGLNRGSEFEVRLPLANFQSGEASAAAPPSDSPAEPRLRVLLVEDSKIVGETFAMLLTAMGHEVRLVQDGPTAIGEFGQYRPDVVFSDISMPGMNGYQFARCLRERHDLGGVVLVALTGYGQAEDRQQAFQAGFDDHMVKPPEFDKLKSLFRSVAARRASAL
jgi:CheY-like chemotaxis protein